ncbi:zinc finger protein OZF-like [Sitodiplosis mosellana]|uniref:zinc finger protein OZF-like n=1 Tax=Sitodiplosis mosellana TaxID=263140 RepID=UPI002443F5AE|nr:zinc finger protein OZF-like [Sitodiplosis mosellana]
MAMIQSNIQSSHSLQIKQEVDIKQEPVSTCDLFEISASTYRNVRQVPGSSGCGDEYDFDYLSLEEDKTDIKTECDNKKEEESNTNVASGGGVVGNQQVPMYDGMMPENDKNTQNAQKQGGDANENSSKPHKCVFCEYSTLWKSHLNLHSLKHTGEKPFGCDFCLKRFAQKNNLRVHMKVHVEEFLFHCPGCLKGFDEKNEKVAHEMNCKARRYECHLCKESFGSNNANMMKHIRVHSGEKPFECEECFKQFAEKSSLNRHLKLHAGPRPFRCSRCRQGFSQQDEKSAHEGKCNRRVWECYVCDKLFGLLKFYLMDHMRTHSGETPFECQHCSKQFKQEGGLRKHMRSHTKKLPFKCSICHQGFSKQTQCKVHERNCNQRCYECHLCKRFFDSKKTNLEHHMRIHSGMKPFQCELCWSKFSQKSNLKAHVGRVHSKESSNN